MYIGLLLAVCAMIATVYDVIVSTEFASFVESALAVCSLGAHNVDALECVHVRQSDGWQCMYWHQLVKRVRPHNSS